MCWNPYTPLQKVEKIMSGNSFYSSKFIPSLLALIDTATFFRTTFFITTFFITTSFIIRRKTTFFIYDKCRLWKMSLMTNVFLKKVFLKEVVLKEVAVPKRKMSNKMCQIECQTFVCRTKFPRVATHSRKTVSKIIFF